MITSPQTECGHAFCATCSFR
ncbi:MULTISPECIES: hypothetical protein [Thalassospira]